MENIPFNEKPSYDLVCPDSKCEYGEAKRESGLVTDQELWFCPVCGKRMIQRENQ